MSDTAVVVVQTAPDTVEVRFPGVQGPAGTLEIGTVSTGTPGSHAVVTNVGTASAAILNISIPRGVDGDDGEDAMAPTVGIGTVTTGTPGTNATVNNTGTATAILLSFSIPRGDAGEDGDDGTTATIAVRNVSTGAPGSSATVTNVGTANAAVFDFSIPRGNPGVDGSGSGTVTSVTGNAPIQVATGTDTPVVSIIPATTSVPGSMSAADKTKLDGVAEGATANSTDAALKDRANHTGTQSADTITDGVANKLFLAADRTKLTAIAAGATANSADAVLLARANHTGTQTVSTISDFLSGVMNSVLTGLSLATGTPVVAADGVLAAIGKLQAQITLRATLADPAFTGVPTAPTAVAATNTTQIATTAHVFAERTNTATLTGKSLTAPTLTGAIAANGSVRRSANALAALAIDCSLGNFFTKTIAANSTLTFSNVPATGNYYAAIVQLTHTSGTLTHPTGTIWADGTAPTLTAGKVHLLFYCTSNGGTTWRASVLKNYAS